MSLLIRNTRDRSEVERVRRASVELANAGTVQRADNWDAKSTWQNTLFTHAPSGAQWVVYPSDHAWPGEVKVLGGSESVNVPIPVPWEQQGCEVCRAAWSTPGRPGLKHLGTNFAQHAHIHRCLSCGSYWEELERYAHQISESEAKELMRSAQA
jgi:hypothetical protein